MLRLSVFTLLVVAAATVAFAADDPASEQRPNVLFLICDDLNCDLGCYGDEAVQSPNIDALARRGVRFDKAYCQYPLCGPSRASFMTGLYPDQTLIVENRIYIRQTMPKVVTMTQRFRQAGYHATRIGKIFHYGVPRDIGTGGHDDPSSWDKTINPEGHDTAIEDKIFTLQKGQFGGTLSWYADDVPDEQQTDGIGATEADAVLEKYAATDRPFFLAVGLYRPHTPYVAPEKYFDLYPADSITVPEVPDGYESTIPDAAVRTIRGNKSQRDLKPELARQAIQAYHASITFADAQIGRILGSLSRHGLAENTIVVFTSDHGYHMGQHGHYQKQTLFEDATHVPLVIAGPGIAADRTSASLAEMVDFYPTLCSLCGVEAPNNLSGLDLSATLRNPTEATRTDALSQHRSGYALRTDRYRIVQWGDHGADGYELYDHHTDPAEMHNLADAPESESTLRRLSVRLNERINAAAEKPAGLVQYPLPWGRR